MYCIRVNRILIFTAGLRELHICMDMSYVSLPTMKGPMTGHEIRKCIHYPTGKPRYYRETAYQDL